MERPALQRGTLAISTVALRRASARMAAIGSLAGGLLILLIVSGYIVPPYLYLVAVALPLTGIGLLTRERGERLAWTGYVLGFVLFAQLRALADLTPVPVQFEYAIDLERALFGHPIPTVRWQAAVYRLGAWSLWDKYVVLVHLSYFIVPHAFAFLCWRARKDIFRRYAAAALMTYYIGLVAGALLPTAPPWLAGQTGYLPHVYRVAQDLWTQTSPDAYDYAYAVAGTNDVAAMPSLHVAIAAVIALAARRFGAIGAAAGTLYVASMTAILVYGGEHYVIDAIVGALLAGAAWWTAGRGPARAPVPARDRTATFRA